VKCGSKMRIARQVRGLTLEEAAELINIHFTTLAKLELDQITPSVPMLMDIAKAYDVPPASLLPDEED
jgi:transcriptional regulator with XRE-family HTH domain